MIYRKMLSFQSRKPGLLKAYKASVIELRQTAKMPSILGEVHETRGVSYHGRFLVEDATEEGVSGLCTLPVTSLWHFMETAELPDSGQEVVLQEKAASCVRSIKPFLFDTKGRSLSPLDEAADKISTNLDDPDLMNLLGLVLRKMRLATSADGVAFKDIHGQRTKTSKDVPILMDDLTDAKFYMPYIVACILALRLGATYADIKDFEWSADKSVDENMADIVLLAAPEQATSEGRENLTLAFRLYLNLLGHHGTGNLSEQEALVRISGMPTHGLSSVEASTNALATTRHGKAASDGVDTLLKVQAELSIEGGGVLGSSQSPSPEPSGSQADTEDDSSHSGEPRKEQVSKALDSLGIFPYPGMGHGKLRGMDPRAAVFLHYLEKRFEGAPLLQVAKAYREVTHERLEAKKARGSAIRSTEPNVDWANGLFLHLALESCGFADSHAVEFGPLLFAAARTAGVATEATFLLESRSPLIRIGTQPIVQSAVS